MAQANSLPLTMSAPEIIRSLSIPNKSKYDKDLMISHHKFHRGTTSYCNNHSCDSPHDIIVVLLSYGFHQNLEGRGSQSRSRRWIWLEGRSSLSIVQLMDHHIFNSYITISSSSSYHISIRNNISFYAHLVGHTARRDQAVTSNHHSTLTTKV